MDWLAILLIGLYSLLFVASVALLVYFIVRRVKIKKTEDFEKRNN
jgi:cytochrome bd-type quinol oxidase subunit 1